MSVLCLCTYRCLQPLRRYGFPANWRPQPETWAEAAAAASGPQDSDRKLRAFPVQLAGAQQGMTHGLGK